MSAVVGRGSRWTDAVDRLGVVASAVCFVHCLLMPVVLSLLAVYAHLLPSEEHTHRVLAVIVTGLGAVAVVSGYRRHKRLSVLVFMALGVALVSTGALWGDRFPTHWAEVAVTLLGSRCLIVAHRRNHTFCRSCNQCG